MFEYSLDNKLDYTNDDGVVLKDLSKTIFDETADYPTISSVYRVRQEYTMRPDLVSKASYGDERYAEMILKYSDIPNPFAIDTDDVVVVATLNTVENPIDKNNTAEVQDNSAELVKRYHKYIDPKKVPDTTSEVNTVSTISDTEANLSTNKDSGITVKNGKVYFGGIPASAQTEDTKELPSNEAQSQLVDCAKNGVTLGQFLRATLKNENK